MGAELIKKRSKIADLVHRVIMSGLCDSNLHSIEQVSKQYACQTMTWQQGCEALKIGKSKFFTLVDAGEIHKIDTNAYTTQSIIQYKEKH